MRKHQEIDAVITYIHQNIHNPISLSDLANHVAYSPFHFTRIFKEQIGISPLYYVSSLRLQKAKDMLLKTNLTVRDIGLEVGQQSLGTFTTRFTERVGQTPSQFRKASLEADKQLESLQVFSEWESIKTVSQFNIVKGTITAEVPFSGIIWFISAFNS